jgi:hypothetical protein
MSKRTDCEWRKNDARLMAALRAASLDVPSFIPTAYRQMNPEIGALAIVADYGGPNGGECPECKEIAEVTGMGGGTSTCLVCNLCFKYHHSQSHHGNTAA